jgi:hypothetical protein
MGAIVLEQFGGAIPIISKRLLPNNYASRAVNCDLLSGELRGAPALGLLHDFGSGTIYEKGFRIPAEGGNAEVWMGLLSRHARVLRNQISNDAFLRYTILDGNSPGVAAAPRFNTHARIIAGDPSYLLGIPAPLTVPSMAVAGGAGVDVTRAYVYTFVDSYGQEGQPSPSVLAVGKIDGTWTISSMETSVLDASERAIVSKKIYRTVFTNSGVATFRWVATVPLATASYADTQAEDKVAGNVALESTSFAEPPAMEGIVSSANGFLVGWAGNNVYFSEPYRPWAWPPEYTITTDFRILGAAYVDQTLVCVTASHPVFITGSDPSAVSVSKTEAIEAGVSAPSIVSAPDGVYFATKTGLLRASSGGLENVTQKLIDSVDWSKTYGENIRSAARFETTYIGLLSAGGGFILDWQDQRVAYTELHNDLPFDMIWPDQWTGELHVMASNKVFKWGDPANGRSNFLWRSKEFYLPAPANMAALLISMETGNDVDKPWGLQGSAATGAVTPPTPIEIDPDAVSAALNQNGLNTFMLNEQGRITTPPTDFEESLSIPEGVQAFVTVYANKRRVWQGGVVSDQLIRLPSGFKTVSWELSIVSRTTIYSVRLATTAKELRLA